MNLLHITDDWVSEIVEYTKKATDSKDYALLLYNRQSLSFEKALGTLNDWGKVEKEVKEAFYEHKAVISGEFLICPIITPIGALGVLLLRSSRLAEVYYTEREKRRGLRGAYLIGKVLTGNVLTKLVKAKTLEECEYLKPLLPVGFHPCVALFMDIRGFSRLLQQAKGPRVYSIISTFIRELLSDASEIIYKHYGIVNKFLGDGIFAIFGAVLYENPTESCLRAVCAALEIKDKFEKKRERWLKNISKETEMPLDLQVTFNIGIGESYGEALFLGLGKLGVYEEYSCLGGSVNLAKRIESLAGREKIEEERNNQKVMKDSYYCSILFSQTVEKNLEDLNQIVGSQFVEPQLFTVTRPVSFDKIGIYTISSINRKLCPLKPACLGCDKREVIFHQEKNKRFIVMKK